MTDKTILEIGLLAMVALSQLSDVDVSGLADGQVIYWDATAQKWKPTTAGTTPGSVTFAVIGGSPEDNAALASALNAKFSSTNLPAYTDVTGLDGHVNTLADARIAVHAAEEDPHPDYLTQDEASSLFAEVNHNHSSDTWFTDALATKEDTGVAATAVSDHEAASDPHAAYYNEERGDARYSQLGHVHDNPKLDDLATPDDNTDLNATTLRHGLLPKLSGNSTEALKGDGTWGEVAGEGGTPLVVSTAPAVSFRPHSTYTNLDIVIPASTTPAEVSSTHPRRIMDLSNAETLDFQLDISGTPPANSKVAVAFSLNGTTWVWATAEAATAAPASAPAAGAFTAATGLQRGTITLDDTLKEDGVYVSLRGWGDGINAGTIDIGGADVQMPLTGATGPVGPKGDPGDPGTPGSPGIVLTTTEDFSITSGQLALKRLGRVGRYTSGATGVGLTENAVIGESASAITFILTTSLIAQMVAISNRGSANITIQAGTGQSIQGGTFIIPPATADQSPSTICLWRDPTSNNWRWA